MMQHLWLAVAVVATLLVGYLILSRARSRQLRLRIEPVPQARLDNTPVERTEIVSEVRVRRRADGEPACEDDDAVAAPAETQAPTPPAETLLTGLSAGEPFDVASSPAAADPVPAESATPAPAVAEPVAEAVAEQPARLSQADLFPDATVPVSPRRGARSTPLFNAADADEPVDAALKSGNGNEALPAIELVISLHVMARDKAFEGRKLLELLLQYGLRFGDMNIFHRHEFPTGHGVVLFSLAQAMEPGTFNIDTLERDTVGGVSLFLSLPGYKSLTAYDLMVDTARRLAKELDADLLDQHSQVVTAGQLESWRDQVTEFERKRLMSS